MFVNETPESIAQSLFEVITNNSASNSENNWTLSNSLVIKLQKNISKEIDPSTRNDAFTTNFFRLMKEPVKSLISDPRSQQVRDICALLMTMANICGDLMRPFMREIFPFVLEALKVPNKVMIQTIDDCITHLISTLNFKYNQLLLLLASEIKSNKASFVREKCLVYLNQILQLWQLNDKDLAVICDVLKSAFTDASPGGRDLAKKLYYNLYIAFPAKAEKLRLEITPATLQQKLLKIENEANQAHPTATPAEAYESMHKTAPASLLQAGNQGLPLSPTRPVNLAASFQSPSKNQPNFTPVRSKATTIDSPGKALTKTPTTSGRKEIMTPKAKEEKAREEKQKEEREKEAKARSTMNSSQRINTFQSPGGSTQTKSRRRSVIQNPFNHMTTIEHENLVPLKVSSKYTDELDEFHRTIISESGSGSLFITTSESILTSGLNSMNSTGSSGSTFPNSYSNSTDASTPQKPMAFPSPLPPAPPQPLVQPPQPSSATTSSSSSDYYLKKYSLNMKAYVKLNGSLEAGFIRYIGETEFAQGIWIGLELTKPIGKNNGTVQGVYYFDVQPLFGLFVKEENIVLDCGPSNKTTSESSTSSHNQSHPYYEQAHDLSSVATASTLDATAMPDNSYMSPMRDIIVENDDDFRSPPKKKLLGSYTTPSSMAHLHGTDVATHDNLDLQDNSGSNAGKKRKSSTCILLHLNEIALLLGRQIEIVHIIATEEKKEHANAGSLSSLRREINAISTQEIDLIHKLQDYLNQAD